jgi:uncharacterized protein involved in exopolysaccharide biosynthesis
MDSIKNQHMEDKLPNEHDLINLKNVFQLYADSFRSIVISTLLFALIGAVYTYSQPKIYRAEALVSAIDNQRSSTASLSNQFSGLANLIGMSNSSTSSSEVNIAIMLSGNFLKDFILKNNLLPSIFAEEWDEKGKKWISGKPPTIRSAVVKLQNSVKVEPKLSLKLVAVEWTDPLLTAIWANGLIEHLNDHIRQQKINESEKSINFLEKELVKTTLINNEYMLFGLIEEQAKNIVLANVREEYAFKFIDPAITPIKKIRPLNIQNIILFSFLGFVLGSLFVFIRTYIKTFSKSFF